MKKAISLLLAIVLLLSCCGTAVAAKENLAKKFKIVNTYVSGQFTDVAEDAWYAKSVRAAYELGIVKGSSAMTYNPNGNITIAETITLAARLHNTYEGGEGFTSSQPWYQTYVDYAIEEKIIERRQFSDYSAPATRAQFAEILAHALPEDELQPVNEIKTGAIPDVPIDATYADEVYLLYRAGVLTGNDAVGTFTPDSSIQRSAVAAIVARMAIEDMRKSITLESPNGEIVTEKETQYVFVEYRDTLYNPNDKNGYYYNADGEVYADWGDMLDLLAGDILTQRSVSNPYVGGTIYFGYGWEEVAVESGWGRYYEATGLFVPHVEIEKRIKRHENRYVIDTEDTWLSATEKTTTRTLKYNRRALTAPTSEDIKKAGFENGKVYDWNGVRIYITSKGDVRYNYNDLAKFFGVKRTFTHTIRENEPTLIVARYK